MLQYDVKAISRKFFGHEVCLPERSLSQPKARCVCIRSIHQSNRSISVRLLFLFCSRVFISRSYENRSNDATDIPIIFSGTLPLASEFHSHQTRFASNLNFRRPQINNNYGASTLSFIASKIWETISLELKKLCYYRLSKHCKLYQSAKVEICVLEYIDLVYFSSTTFSHVFVCFVVSVYIVTLAPFLFV